MSGFTHKLRTVALDDETHRRLRIEASQRCKDGQDIREVMMAIVGGLLAPYLDELEAAAVHGPAKLARGLEKAGVTEMLHLDRPSAARRALVEQGLMTREEAVYRFTPLGEAAWRVERFVEAGGGPEGYSNPRA